MNPIGLRYEASGLSVAATQSSILSSQHFKA
jgi:hypothetical protein